MFLESQSAFCSVAYANWDDRIGVKAMVQKVGDAQSLNLVT